MIQSSSRANRIVSPTQVAQYLKGVVEYDQFLSSIAVEGEISGYKKYPSGHHYFSLKDATGVLQCVMFKGDGDGLAFAPENGMRLVATGKITVYPRDGKYQMQVRGLKPQGVGDLHQAFEQLKAKLSAEGLFDPAHKKPLPVFPSRVALITSPAGAVVQDMIRILSGRFPLAEIRVIPVTVQGPGSAETMAAAIGWVNLHQLADVIIVGRGGGSMEDLWSFNEEVLVRGVFASAIPVVSAVGHEPDVTLCDYVADVRAATPTHGAELVVPEHQALCQYLEKLSQEMQGILRRQIQERRRHLGYLAQAPGLMNPRHILEEKGQQLDRCREHLEQRMATLVSHCRHRCGVLAGQLHALSPLEVIVRGYAIPRTPSGQVLASVEEVSPGDALWLQLKDGKVHCTAQEILPQEI